MAQAVAVVLGTDQAGDEVLAKRVPPASDHLVYVGAELIYGLQDVGRGPQDPPRVTWRPAG